MRVAIAALLLVLVPTVAAAQPGTQITISQPAEATTMDPGRSTQVLTVNYFYNLYDTLTRWDAALKIQPGLATSWKRVNDTTWEFALRQGVKFHDGSPFTATDVKATLDRILTPGKTVVTAGFTTIESVQAVDPRTVRIVTKKPDPLMLVRMAQMGAQILPARLTTDDGAKELARKPVGTGPYRFVEWVKDERLNGKYWAGSQPGHRFHDLMEAARYTLDPARRKQLYAEATQLFHDENPWIQLFQEVVVYGTSRRVSFTVRPDYRLIVAEMSLAK